MNDHAQTAVMVVALWMAISGAYACDVCGGSASGSFLGILPQYQKHFVGLTYQYQSFNSVHPVVAGETAPAESVDLFQSATLWGRFYPLKRVQVFAFLPWQYNTVQEAGRSTVMSGIGDAKLLVNYMLLNTSDSADRSWKHMLFAGAGVKAPTGKTGYTNKEGIILSNMQPGTGSWDFLANANYTIRYKKAGLNADISYQLNTVNSRDYKYGNKLNAGVTGFYSLQNGNHSLLPQLGIRLQQSAIDLSSNTYNIRNTYSGGYQLYLATGAGVYFRSFAISSLLSIPLKQHYAGGLVTGHLRCEVQLQYLF